MAVQVQEGMTDTAAARALMGEEVQEEEEEVEKEAVVIMEEVTAEMVMVVVTAPTAATVEQLVRPCALSVHALLFAPSRGQILRTPPYMSETATVLDAGLT